MIQSPAFVEKVLPTILIVDDTPANIGVIADTLEEQGYRVLVAQDGEEGLRRVDFVQPDLILLDVMMPGIDGFEVCRILKKQATTRDIPVIFMTARSETADIVSGFRAGGVDYVTKPLQVEEVLARIETQLKLSLLQKRMEMQNAQLQRYREQLEQRVAERTTSLSVSNQNLREETQERKRTQERLTLVDFALNQTLEAVYIANNQDFRFIYVNAEASRMLGYSREELMSMSILDLDPDATPEGFMQLKEKSDITGTVTLERRHRAKDGRIFPVEIFGTPFDYQGKVLILSMVRDITERKQKEMELRSLSRKLGAISRCNQTLVRAETEQELLNSVCKLVCEEAGYRMAWVGFAEDDAGKTVRPVAQSGYDEGYLESVNITWADTERGLGPTGTAIRTGQTTINQNSFESPAMAPWREAAIKHGFQSSIAFPLIVNGRTMGALSIFSAEPYAFQQEEIILLEELAGDVAYGVQTLRTRDEKALAEVALHAREQEFRAMIDNSPDNIARYDTQCRRVYVNPALQAKFGLPIAQILGKTSESKESQSPLADVQTYMQRIQKVLQTGREERFEISWNSPDGVESWGDLRVVPEFGKEGKVASVLAINRDISARKHMENALREREQRYHGIFDNVLDALFLLEVTPDGRFRNLDVNPAFEKSVGISRAELVGKFVEETVPEETAKTVIAKYRKCVEEGTAIDEEATLDLPSGLRHYYSTLIPVCDDSGRIYRIVGITRDITERKRIEQYLIQRESELRSVMESSPDTIIRYDSKGQITYLNTKLLRILNVAPKDVIGKLPHEAWPDGRFAELEEAVFRVLETKQEACIVIRRNLQVEIRFQEVRVVPEWNDAGKVIGVIAFGRDITDLRRYEQALEESRVQLRGLAAKSESTREEERKHIAREVHDELGQILTGLQLNISVLEHQFSAGSAQLGKQLQETRILTEKALGVARNVATALRPAAMDLGIISALEWLTERFSANTRIRCKVNIEDSDIQLDDNHAIALFRIVQEALTNVARHAKASRVDISLTQDADDYVLKVRDNGLGFDVSVKKLDSFGVVGIRERALMLGGIVTINSSPGKGTEINVRIPVNKK